MEIIKSIELILENKLIQPTLILIYSGIDIVASLTVPIKRDVQRKDFEEWVNKYMVPHFDKPLTAKDIYAARCAVLHTMKAESKLSKEGQASQIYYVHGDKKEEELQFYVDLLGDSHKVIHIEKLLKYFRMGIADMFENLDKDENLLINMKNRSRVILSNTSLTEFEKYLK
ncbi:hypothetical protein AB4114_29720 [Paenibacillus sp. 2RAB27]|uniref:hypothetical protein n=1 Tax=Paenibacillus sp. 2RAB27 TaxID=3232991 RepID=UPI003F986AEB